MNEINETESPLVERSRGEGEIPASQPLPFPTTCSEACWGSTVTIWKSLTFSIYIGHSVMLKFMLYYYFHFSSKILTLYFVPPTRSPTFEQLKHQGPQIGEWKSTLLMIFHRFAWPCRNCDWPSRNYSSLLGTHSSGWGHGCYLLIAIGGWRPPRQWSGKESTPQCRIHKRRGFYPWVEKIPWSMKWQSTPVFLPGKSHGQRSLVGYSPWVAESSTHWGWALSYCLSDSFAQICCHFYWLWTETLTETFSRKKSASTEFHCPISFTVIPLLCLPA